MNHYIDLMRLRISPKVELKIDLPEKDKNLKIPPLLFIPFIENAFKHGSFSVANAIEIYLKSEKNHLSFSCKNQIKKGRVPGLGWCR